MQKMLSLNSLFLDRYAIYHFLAAAALLLLGIFLYSRNRSLRHFSYLLIVLSGFLCLWADAVIASLARQDLALFWIKIVYLGITLLVPSAYFFSSLWSRPLPERDLLRKKKGWVLFNYLCAAAFLTLFFMADRFRSSYVKDFFGSFPRPGKWSYIYLAYFFGVWGVSFRNLIRSYFDEPDETKRTYKKRMLVAFLIAFIGSIEFLSTYGISIYLIGLLTIFLFTVIVAYMIICYHFMNVNVVLTRAGIFLFVYSAVLAIPFWLGFRGGHWVWAVVLTSILAFLGPFIYNHLRRKTEAIIFKEHSRYKVVLQEYIKEEQARRQRAMDHFSASLAHEIDNPVYAIMGMADVVKAKVSEDLKGKIPDEERCYLEDRLGRISKDIGRISKMIKAIREFSSQTEGELTDLNMDEVLLGFLSIVEPQFKYEGITFIKEIEPNIRTRGNKIHLEEVLINFSTNAIHAVKMNKDKEKKITLKVYRNSPKTFLIEFSDNGYGIKKNMLEDIFLDFVTTKASTVGAGIGLSRVRKIVENYQGRVWAESDGEGKGAVFFVELASAP